MSLALGVLFLASRREKTETSLFQLDIAFLDHVVGPVVLLLDFLGELFRRITRRCCPLLFQSRNNFGFLQGFRSSGMQLGNDFRRRTLGSQQTIPDMTVHLRAAFL